MKLKALAFPSEGIKQHRDLSEHYCGERAPQYGCVKDLRQIIPVQLNLDEGPSLWYDHFLIPE